jgi:hypothetical protein
VPENCTLGTDYFCLRLADRVDCKELPLKILSVIPSSLLGINPFNGLSDLDQALLEVTPRNLKVCLGISAAFAGIAIVTLAAMTLFPSVQFIFLPVVHKLGLSWVLEISTLFRFICSGLCSAPLIAITVILYGLRARAKLPKEVSLETGAASRWVLAALTCAIVMIFSVAIEWALYIV